jgi:hypothetical protein
VLPSELVRIKDLYDESPEVEDPNESHERSLPMPASSAVVNSVETMCQFIQNE